MTLFEDSDVDASDIVLLDLLRVVTSDGWDRRRSAEMLARRYSADELWRARAHVLNALARTSSPTAARAAATLQEALWRVGPRPGYAARRTGAHRVTAASPGSPPRRPPTAA